MKKGLFVCYDPHALMQFLQFYCMNDFPAEWDVLCLPVEDGEECMHAYCEKTGLFKNVFIGSIEYKSLSIIKKFRLFIYMFFFAIIGLRKRCCAKILNGYVGDITQYDVLCANYDSGFISGMLANFGLEKDVVYFEDGAGDYHVIRSKWKTAEKSFFSFYNLSCVIMARLGYFAKGSVYFNQTKFCYKYVSNKLFLAYRNYKEIREFNLKDNNVDMYLKFIKKTYPELDTLNIPKDGVLLFTNTLKDLTSEYEVYNKKIIEIISKKYNSLIIKKHPRDNCIYNSANIRITEINKNIPAEVLGPLLINKVCYFMGPSSCIINLSRFLYHAIVFHINDSQIVGNTLQNDINYLEKFVKGKYEVIEI